MVRPIHLIKLIFVNIWVAACIPITAHISTLTNGYPAPLVKTPITGIAPSQTSWNILGVTETINLITFRSTQAAAIEMTLTAWPTQTSSPTFPVGAPQCEAKDLSATIDGNGLTGGKINYVIVLNNISHNVCYLENLPNLKFVVLDGSLINGIEYTGDSQYEKGIGVGAGNSVAFWAIWSSGCKTIFLRNALLRFILPNNKGFIDLLNDDFSGNRCEPPETIPSLYISAFYYL